MENTSNKEVIDGIELDLSICDCNTHRIVMLGEPSGNGLTLSSQFSVKKNYYSSQKTGKLGIILHRKLLEIK